MSALDQVALTELIARTRGLSLLDLKKRSEDSSVSNTSRECSDESETPAVSTPSADAAHHLSQTASSIPPVEPVVFTLKRSAFRRHLLRDEVDLGESTPCGSHEHAVFSMLAIDGSTRQVPGANPSTDNMSFPWYHVQDLLQVLWAKSEGIQQPTCLDPINRT